MVITLTGINSFLLKAELNRLVGEFVAEHGDFGLERLDGEEAAYDRISESVQSLPFLAGKKLVVLKNGGANKQFAENIEHILESMNETTDLILVEPKLDKRLSYYKTLKKKTDFKEFNELDGQGLANWLVRAVREQGGELKPADARYLLERVGANQQLLSNELDKLLNYQAKITRETIDLLTELTPQSTIFELLDAAFTGNTKRALTLYAEQRALKVEPQQIIAMLGWQLHVLAVIKTAGDRNADEIARESKINPYVIRKSQSIARKLTLPELKKLVHDALTLDVRLKSESIDADEALQHYLLTVAL
jgi:DNA polymerase III subunit delta